MHRSTRRGLLQFAGAGLCLGLASETLRATEFWDKKDPSLWSTDEILLLTTRSPWAKDTRIDFKGRGQDASQPRGPDPIRDPTTGTITNSDGSGYGRSGGKAPDVIVTWESALPLFDALRYKLAAVFINHYVIGIRDLPIAVDPGAPNQTSEELLDWLKNSATLRAKSRDPVQAGVVESARGGTMILFGFLRDLLPLTSDDKEVLFTLDTNQLAIRTKFEPKEMKYRGKLAL